MPKNKDTFSLAHTCWNCKYHIVFAPKYRRKVFFKNKRIEIGQILRKLCEFKGINIVEAEVCPDHIHMLVSIPPYMSIAQFVGTLKSKSALMIFDRHANLKYRYGSRNFWARGYFVDTVGKNETLIGYKADIIITNLFISVRIRWVSQKCDTCLFHFKLC